MVERRGGQWRRGNNERNISWPGHDSPTWGVRVPEELSDALSCRSSWENSSAGGRLMTALFITEY